MGVLPEQSALELHCTQRLAATWHTGVVPTQAMVLLMVHWTQAPICVPLLAQAGVAPAHSASRMQARQVRDGRLHTGVLPAQCALELHCTQRFVSSLQTGVVPMHAIVLEAVHCTQAPAREPLVAQAGVAPRHSLSVRQGRQVRVVSSHTGVVPEQSASVLQRTQRLVSGLQTPMEGVHALALLGVHWTQAPALGPKVAHAGVAPPHWLSAVQGPQRRVERLQMGVLPEHSALELHWTQVLVVVLHTGVAPVHARLLLAVHCTHPRPAMQAGVAPEHSASTLHGRQRPVLPSQMGAVAGQSTLLRH